MEKDANCVPDALEDGIVIDTDNSAQSLRIIVCKHLTYTVTQLGIA